LERELQEAVEALLALESEQDEAKVDATPWTQYLEPLTNRKWRLSPSGDFFYEDDPSWQQFQFYADTGEVRFYW
jgi:hypothetical protein